jgi:hypothetical protein
MFYHFTGMEGTDMKNHSGALIFNNFISNNNSMRVAVPTWSTLAYPSKEQR